MSIASIPAQSEPTPDLSDIFDALAQFKHDPYGFVIFAFPWGEPGTELANMTGPEPWQEKFLKQVRDKMADPRVLLTNEIKDQRSRTSGHGIGKSALVAWLILWSMSTCVDTRGVVTANTETQLRTKTWVETAKWHRLFIGRDLFRLTATAMFARDPAHASTWRFDAVPWSERNTEAFAGLHNQGSRITLIFDEASAIPDLIWEVAEGALTDRNTQIFWWAFGNPTKNTGRFRECFPGGRFSHRWDTEAVDSREVSLTDKEQIDKWISDWGEDHDFVRVRVRGVFPRVDAESFISRELVDEATNREVEPQLGMPVYIGVDVGRFGDDPSVIYPRKGRDARSLPVEVYYGIDTMTLAKKVAEAVLRHRASFAFVDAGGVGGGVVDRLHQLRIPVIPVDFGSKPDGTNIESGVKYANKRAEIWGGMKEWLATGALPESVEGAVKQDGTLVTLQDELVAPTYTLNNKEEIQLERKQDMRRRGVASPNIADALATTMAMPDVGIITDDYEEINQHTYADYDPFARERMLG